MDLRPGETVLGRSRTCTIRLDDPAASRQHVTLTLVDGKLRARDLGSSNGTYVNGQRLEEERLLEGGDRVTIGETEITIVPRQESRPAAVAAAPQATVMSPVAEPPCRACGSALPAATEACPSCGYPTATTDAPPPGPPSPPPVEAPALAAPPPSPAPPATEEPSSAVDDVELQGLASGRSPAEPAGGFAPQTPAAATPAAAAPWAPEPPSVSGSPGGAIHQPAGFWIRALAVWLDALWMTIFLLVVSLPLKDTLALMIPGLLSLALGIGVPVVGWGRFGTTPGKRVLGLWVCTVEGDVGIGSGRAALRWLGYLVSGAALGVGFLMVGLAADKRGLHDHIAGTYVCRLGR